MKNKHNRKFEQIVREILEKDPSWDRDETQKFVDTSKRSETYFRFID